MTNPGNTDSFESTVAKVFEKVKLDDKGKLEFPEGTSEEVIYAVKAEKRRRDTQSEYTKERQNNVALKAEKDELLSKLSNNVELKLTDQEEEELDELKFSDPEEWRSRMNSLENKAVSQRNKELKERLKEVSEKGTQAAQIEQRKFILEEFLERNPDTVITDDVIENDIPPRIKSKLEKGTINFEEFLQEVDNYLRTGKVIGTESLLNQPDINKAGGSDSLNKAAKNSSSSYEDEIY